MVFECRKIHNGVGRNRGRRSNQGAWSKRRAEVPRQRKAAHGWMLIQVAKRVDSDDVESGARG
jgi:hypothetical protein